jgi:hypothetical protein
MTDTIVITVDGQETVTIRDPHPSLKNDIQVHGEGGVLEADDDGDVQARLEKNETRYIR